MNIHAWFETLTRGLQDRRNARSGNVMLELLRPDLGRTPAPLRALLEPVVATLAVMVLVGLLGISVTSFTVFLLAAALMVAILTQVFGIELGLQMPTAPR